MKLHEAIEEAIRLEVAPASIEEIAFIINYHNLYQREDGKPVEPNQVAARINNYPLLFEINENGHVVIRKEAQLHYQHLVYQLQDLIKSHNSRHTDVIIATCIFLERVKRVFPDYLKKFKNNSFTEFERNSHKLQVGEYQTGFAIRDEDENLISELFQQLPHRLKQRIFDIVQQYDFSLNASSHRQFGAFYNNLLNSSSLSKGALGDFATPTAISKIVTALADIKNNDTVFDPFGGNAGIFCDIIRTKNEYYNLRLNDIDRYTVWLGKMNLVLNNFVRFEFHCKDSIEDYVRNQDLPKKYDWIITHPPFGGRFSKDIINSFRRIYFGPSTRSELVFLEMILGQLNDNGKAIIVIPESFLFTEDKAFIKARKFLVNNSSLAKVISLPIGAFLPYTSAKASILFVNNDISESINEGVEFLDLSDNDLKTIVENNEFSLTEFTKQNPARRAFATREEIEEQGYSLVVNRYLHKRDISYSNEYRQLKEVIKEKYSGVTYNQKALSRIDGIPYVNIKDLSDEKQFYNLNPEKIDTFVMRNFYEGNFTQRHVPKQAILLAKIGNKLKPTLNVADRPIAVSGNILVVIPDMEVISPGYLISQFYEEYVLNQVNRIRGGAAQPFVRIEDLLNIYIKVPPKEKQKEEELKFTLEQMQNIPTRDFKEIEPSKDEIDLASAIEHEYKNLKNPLTSNISTIKDFLEKKIQNKEVIDWNEKVATNFTARTVQMVFSDIDEIMNEMSSLIDDIVTVVNLDKEGNLSNKKNVLALPYFERTIKKFQREFPDAKFLLQYIERKAFTQVLIGIDENLFSKVIRNFVSNSLKHGYEDSAEKPIYMFLSISDDGLYFEIDLVNDGKPFEDGFSFNDFISFGKRTGANKGSGIGGFIMNRIVLHHNGHFEMITVNKDDSLGQSLRALMKTGVHFRIKLPIVK